MIDRSDGGMARRVTDRWDLLPGGDREAHLLPQLAWGGGRFADVWTRLVAELNQSRAHRGQSGIESFLDVR